MAPGGWISIGWVRPSEAPDPALAHPGAPAGISGDCCDLERNAEAGYTPHMEEARCTHDRQRDPEEELARWPPRLRNAPSMRRGSCRVSRSSPSRRQVRVS